MQIISILKTLKTNINQVGIKVPFLADLCILLQGVCCWCCFCFGKKHSVRFHTKVGTLVFCFCNITFASDITYICVCGKYHC